MTLFRLVSRSNAIVEPLSAATVPTKTNGSVGGRGGLTRGFLVTTGFGSGVGRLV